MFARVTRRLVAAEEPILEAHGLTMWSYIVLSQLGERPAESQLALAQAIRYDKTRLIALLDELEHDGLLTRQPDPADRRARVVDLTAMGARLLRAARADIREMEAELLAELTGAQQQAMLAALTRLSAQVDS